MEIRVQVPSQALFWLAVVVFLSLAQNLVLLARKWKNRRGWRGVLLRVWLATMSLFSIGLVGEGYFSYFYDATDEVGLTKNHVRWVMRHVRLNWLGFRDDDHPPEPRGNVTRIAVLGDSVTFGAGVRNPADRFTDLWEKSLNEAAAGRDFEVFNIAKPGWGTETHAWALPWTDRVFDFDLVVLAYFPNDISDLLPPLSQPVQPPRFLKALIDRSYALSFLHARWIAGQLAVGKGSQDRLQTAYGTREIWLQQRQRLEEIVAYCASHDIRCLALTVPMIGQLDQYRYESAHEKLAGFWREKGVPHADLLDAFRAFGDSQLRVNRFDRHPNETGHRLIATGLAQLWRRSGAGSPRQPAQP